MEKEKIKREDLISREQIGKRVKELGAELKKEYKDKNLLVVGILKGSWIFLADLARELDLDDVEFDFMEVSSYNGDTESSRNPRIIKDISVNIDGRNVLLVEDIVDTGWSFDTLIKILSQRNPKSLKTCALLSKPERREVEVPIDYLGFEIENKWVEGYGLDTNQRFRGLPKIVARLSDK